VQITLEAARINAGYSQLEACKLFGVHYQTLARWENNSAKMPYDIIEKIPLIYGVSPNNIFFGNKNEFIRLIRDNKLRGIKKPFQATPT
jgi:transcriptional regulator with XRE-family HTH domain